MELRNYTPAYVGLSLVVYSQKGIDLLRDLPQYRPATYLLYTVKNIISHDVFFIFVFDVKSKVIQALPTTSYIILITFKKLVVKKEKFLYLIHEVTNDVQAGESGVDAINLCHDRKVLEMHHILSNDCFGISQVL